MPIIIFWNSEIILLELIDINYCSITRSGSLYWARMSPKKAAWKVGVSVILEFINGLGPCLASQYFEIVLIWLVSHGRAA
jgi:hypothetical protein